MRERAFYFWRLLATATCFAVFGFGGLLLLVFVFPLLRLLVWNKQHRISFAKSVIQWAFQLFVGLMQVLGVLRFEVIGRERLNRHGMLILANHPTLIDTLFLMSFVERADCIVKAELQTNLFTRGAVNAGGFICNNHGTEFIHDCTRSLQNGNNLIVFPEGTRTPANGQICLKRGAANIAIRANCNVTPVIITCRPRTLGKHEKWWRIPPARANFRIEVQEDIKIDQFINESVSEIIAARHLTTYLQTYFSERIQYHV
jgi:1-acyl-sn-glycerol-3-phosphate acyltransferase